MQCDCRNDQGWGGRWASRGAHHPAPARLVLTVLWADGREGSVVGGGTPVSPTHRLSACPVGARRRQRRSGGRRGICARATMLSTRRPPPPRSPAAARGGEHGDGAAAEATAADVAGGRSTAVIVAAARGGPPPPPHSPPHVPPRPTAPRRPPLPGIAALTTARAHVHGHTTEGKGSTMRRSVTARTAAAGIVRRGRPTGKVSAVAATRGRASLRVSPVLGR